MEPIYIWILCKSSFKRLHQKTHLQSCPKISDCKYQYLSTQEDNFCNNQILHLILNIVLNFILNKCSQILIKIFKKIYSCALGMHKMYLATSIVFLLYQKWIKMHWRIAYWECNITMCHYCTDLKVCGSFLATSTGIGEVTVYVLV